MDPEFRATLGCMRPYLRKERRGRREERKAGGENQTEFCGLVSVALEMTLLVIVLTIPVEPPVCQFSVTTAELE